MQTEPSPRWVRGWLGTTAVVDTTHALLFWQDRFPVPNYAYPWSDVHAELIPTDRAGRPGFAAPKAPVRQWYDVRVADQVLPSAAWELADPALDGHVVLTWEAGVLDRWTEEDEEVASHPRDPHKRVDALPSSRRVTVSADGVVLADGEHPVLLYETGLPTRYYFAESDVRLDRLAAATTTSHCPYKGHADRYWSVADRPDLTSIAWSYSSPDPAVGAIADRIAFYNEVLDVDVDGERQARPDSPFSRRGNRPS